MKEKILSKASDLFLTLGFKSVTMDDIAAEMGISKKTIYSHFSTKLKLVQASTSHIMEKIHNGICNICSGDQNPIEELFYIKSLVIEQLKNEKSSPQYQLQKYYPRIFKQIKEEQFQSVNQCVLDNLDRGIKEGFYRKEINKDIISRFYVNGNVGIMNYELFPVNEFNVSDLKGDFLEYHIRAIATEKGLKILLNILKK